MTNHTPLAEQPGSIIDSVAEPPQFLTYGDHDLFFDSETMEDLREGIRQAVGGGGIAVGAGHPALALFAAAEGAGHVYQFVPDAAAAGLLKCIAAANPLPGGGTLADRIDAVIADPATFQLPAELVRTAKALLLNPTHTGLFNGSELFVADNLRGCLDSDGVTVPYAGAYNVELINAQEKFYGLTFNYDARVGDKPGDETRTNQEPYLRVNFGELLPEPLPAEVIASVMLRATVSAPATAVRLTTDWLAAPPAKGQSAEYTNNSLAPALMPLIVFLGETVVLEAGEMYALNLKTTVGYDPLSTAVTVTHIPQ